MIILKSIKSIYKSILSSISQFTYTIWSHFWTHKTSYLKILYLNILYFTIASCNKAGGRIMCCALVSGLSDTNTPSRRTMGASAFFWTHLGRWDVRWRWPRPCRSRQCTCSGLRPAPSHSGPADSGPDSPDTWGDRPRRESCETVWGRILYGDLWINIEHPTDLHQVGIQKWIEKNNPKEIFQTLRKTFNVGFLF